MKRRFQQQFLLASGLRREDFLLDLGCGTLRGGIPLIDYLEPGHYTGIDVRAEAIHEATLELAASGLEHKRPILLACEGLDRLSLDSSFDTVWAFSVLIHMNDEKLSEALGFVARHLAADGVFHANVNVGGREPGAWQEFPVMWRSLPCYERHALEAGLAVEDIGSLAELGHQSGIPAQDDQRMLRFRTM